jgi:hypothetical protein
MNDYIDAVFYTVDMPSSFAKREPVFTPVKNEKGVNMDVNMYKGSSKVFICIYIFVFMCNIGV